jgi:hypothetical protein
MRPPPFDGRTEVRGDGGSSAGTAAAGPRELLGERRAHEALHAHVVTDTVFFQLSDDPAGDPRSELDELFFIDRLHVF